MEIEVASIVGRSIFFAYKKNAVNSVLEARYIESEGSFIQ